jgi:hypothetical protein
MKNNNRNVPSQLKCAQKQFDSYDGGGGLFVGDTRDTRRRSFKTPAMGHDSMAGQWPRILKCTC